MTKRLLIAFLLFMLSLPAIHANQGEVILGAERTDVYFPLIQGKNVALLSNHTGVAGGIHTLDRLIEAGMHVTAIFSPEHGFRGSAGAGDKVGDSVDEKTGVPILPLYDGKQIGRAHV